MNNLEKFNHSVSVLLKAYLNNTLLHGNCHACAVGNMVAEGMGFIYTVDELGELHWIGQEYVRAYKEDSGWANVFATADHEQHFDMCLYNGKAKEQIDSTGYSAAELAKIEYAFETTKRGNSNDEHMFNGLMDVVDVLADIHNIDLTTKDEAKSLFVCTTK